MQIVKSKNLMVADELALECLVCENCLYILKELYESIYTTESIYRNLAKRLIKEDLKVLIGDIQEMPFDVDSSTMDEIAAEYPSLDMEDILVIGQAKSDNMDVMIDDPRKACFFQANDVHVIRPGDVLVSYVMGEEVNYV